MVGCGRQLSTPATGKEAVEQRLLGLTMAPRGWKVQYSCRVVKSLALSCMLCARWTEGFAFVPSYGAGGYRRARPTDHMAPPTSTTGTERGDARQRVLGGREPVGDMAWSTRCAGSVNINPGSRRSRASRRNNCVTALLFSSLDTSTTSSSPSSVDRAFTSGRSAASTGRKASGTDTDADTDAGSDLNARTSELPLDIAEDLEQETEAEDNIENEDEDTEYDEDDYIDESDLPEEVRGAFLDGPGQMLDVEKILAETEFLDPSKFPEDFRTGFVTIMGSPNVGKSTLMNNMIGDRLSIVTPKAGTTRHRITGIITGDDFQLIYQDTPGVLTPAYMLHEGMMSFVTEAMGDADAILFVTDIFEKEFSSPKVFQKMLDTGKPIVVAVNKVDLLPSDGQQGDGEERSCALSAARLTEVGTVQDAIARWEERLPGANVVPISALQGINTDKLAEELKGYIPVGPPLFGTEVMSDKPQRFFAAEIIREQIFGCFSQEIPYSCEVLLDKFKERQAETVLDATIVVSQESQKGMVIGKGGAKIKEVGIKARNALEEFLQTRVNLRLNVKVDKNWRKNKKSLKAYGYIG